MGNFILVTEQLTFGAKGQTEFGPFEKQPLAEKYFDFQMPMAARTDMYYTLVRAQARMAAWDKAGMFEGVPYETRGYDMAPPGMEHMLHMAPPGMEYILPGWPRKLPEKKRTIEVRKGKALRQLWESYLGKHAQKCHP